LSGGVPEYLGAGDGVRVVVGIGLVGICASSCSQPTVPTNLESYLLDIRDGLRPLRAEAEFTESDRAYVAHYGLGQADDVAHRFGYCERGGFRIAQHWFEPPSPKRVVVISHGYYDHAGTWRHAIRALLAADCSVVVYDHPGHGLSGGDRAAIGDFRQYSEVFGEVLEDCRQHCKLPVVLLGHSMGCAVITDYLLGSGRNVEPVQTVFLAPLVRPALWGPSKFLQSAVGWAVPSVPRVFTENSSDPDYLEFVKADPLHHRRVPLAWTGALSAWQQRVEAFAPAPGTPMRILQGGRDATVAWRYNLGFLGRKFPEASVRMFDAGRHQLLNEAEELRSEVLSELVGAVCAGGAD